MFWPTMITESSVSCSRSLLNQNRKPMFPGFSAIGSPASARRQNSQAQVMLPTAAVTLTATLALIRW
jgi:hypothetical protein